MSYHYFHFTLGPVQAFVGQARRTSDFWAGSFILSWLSGVAMCSVKGQGGEIVFPQADDAFLAAITGSTANTLPKQGNVPNRFKARVSTDFNAKQVLDDVQKAWLALADLIYQKDIAKNISEPAEQSQHDGQTQSIWQRQVSQFWEMAWVLTNQLAESDGLDRRKNWRTRAMPQEPGIKCSLMGEWQELSGVVGVRKKDRERREKFWQTLINREPADFTNGEHLCALSFIKRRFKKHFDALRTELSFGEIVGWKLNHSVPSVNTIAAAPWYAEVMSQEADSQRLVDFYQAAKKLGGLPDQDCGIACLEGKKFTGLDGSVFYENSLLNQRHFADIGLAQTVHQALKPLVKAHGQPSPYYVVLMMDGDQLGQKMSDVKQQSTITQGLQKFIQAVSEIVAKHDGFLIYAGGDDVLALLNIDTALSCAAELRGHYQQCFANSGLSTTISAALIYTPIKSPLKNKLHEAHQLLSQVAKDKAGRDAFAVRVYKSSGQALEWAKKWDDALDDPAQNSFKLLSMVSFLANTNAQSNEYFSSKFIYKIRQRFEQLYGNEKTSQPLVLSDEQALDLMVMEYVQSLDKPFNEKEKAEKTKAVKNNLVGPLIEQCKNAAEDNRITVDAALLLRFLAQKGQERGRN